MAHFGPESRRLLSVDPIVQLDVHHDLPVLRDGIGLLFVDLFVAEQEILNRPGQPLLDLLRGCAGHHAHNDALADGEIRKLLTLHGQERVSPKAHENRAQGDNDPPLDHSPFDETMGLHGRAMFASWPITWTAIPWASMGVPEITTLSPSATPLAMAVPSPI